jgi:hypothetical protein
MTTQQKVQNQDDKQVKVVALSETETQEIEKIFE